MYQVLVSLSNNFELLLIIKAKQSKDNHKSLLDKFNVIIEDNIVYKHRILFCNTIEDLCSMIRSIDPIVHIEHSNYVITNLIRYVNEFWFINTNKDSEYKTIYDKVKNDSNNNKLNITDLIPIQIAEYAQSDMFWSICKITHIAIDPNIDGFDARAQRNFPWQEKEFVSAYGVLNVAPLWLKKLDASDRQAIRKIAKNIAKDEE